MKKVAVAIVATLVLAVVSPAFSQPFADVPTDHWAFDAIAELAAKGLIEGYPDGTFRGDRAMTRYEIAMVVARLLARIEAIKIPAPPAPPKIDVTRADIATLQRLINEFRAELAALGVRVTAVEEELAALRGRLDNTRVTGFTFFRYQTSNVGAAAGSPYTFGLFNLTFTGTVGAGTTAVVNALLDNQAGGVFAFGSSTATTWTNTGGYPTPGVTFDRAYLDSRSFGFNWRLGRQAYVLGPIGLLFNSGSIRINGGNNVGVDGLRLTGAFGPISFEAAGFTYAASSATIGGVISLVMGRATFGIIPGWTLGANLYSERWGPGSGAIAGVPPGAAGAAAGAPGTSHNGWSVDLRGSIIPGVTTTFEYATFTPSGLPAETAWQANLVLGLAQLIGLTTFSPTLTVQVKQRGTSTNTQWDPIYAATGDLFAACAACLENLRAWNVQLGLTISPLFRPYVNYESGTVISTGAPHTQLEFGFRSAIAPGVTSRFRYQQGTGTTTINRYRLEVDASW